MAAGWIYTNVSVALTGAATKSLLLVGPGTNVGFTIVELGVGFDGSAAAQGVRVELYRTTTLGSPAGTSNTAVKRTDAQVDTVQSSGLYNLSSEPTAVEILRHWIIAPNGGQLVLQFPLGREEAAKANGGRVGLRYITASGVTPNGIVYMEVEE